MDENIQIWNTALAVQYPGDLGIEISIFQDSELVIKGLPLGAGIEISKESDDVISVNELPSYEIDLILASSSNIDVRATGTILYHPTNVYLPEVKTYLSNSNDLATLFIGNRQLSQLFSSINHTHDNIYDPGHSHDDRYPTFGYLNSWFELVNPGTENEYLRVKKSLAGDKEIQAWSDTGWLPPSIWAAMPAPSLTERGGILLGNLSDPTKFLREDGNWQVVTSGTMDHNALSNKDYASSGHTGFLPDTHLVDFAHSNIATAYDHAISAHNYDPAGTAQAARSAHETAYNHANYNAAYTHSLAVHDAAFVGLGNVPNINFSAWFEIVNAGQANEYLRCKKPLAGDYEIQAWTDNGQFPAETIAGIQKVVGGTRYLREDGTWQTVISGGGTWGSIAGTLSSQGDLQGVLDQKANLSSPYFSGEVRFGYPSYSDPHPGITYDAKFGGPANGIAVKGVSLFKYDIWMQGRIKNNGASNAYISLSDSRILAYYDMSLYNHLFFVGSDGSTLGTGAISATTLTLDANVNSNGHLHLKGVGTTLYFDTTGYADTNGIGTINDYNLSLWMGRGNGARITLHNSDGIVFNYAGTDRFRIHDNITVGEGSFSSIPGIPATNNIELKAQGSGIIMKDETTATRWHVHMHGDRFRCYNGSTELVCITTGDTVTNASYASSASWAARLSTEYISGGTQLPNYFGGGIVKANMLYDNSGNGWIWMDTLWIDTYGGGDVKGANQLCFSKYYDEIGFRRQNFDSSSWGTLRRIWHNGNFDPGSKLNSSSGTASELYNTGWFRNNSANIGLYNQETGNHFYSTSANAWVIGANGYPQLQFRYGHQGSVQGYVYSDSAGFGLLNDVGGWSVRCYFGSGYGGQLYGSWIISNITGTVSCTHAITAANFILSSDRRLKNSIKLLSPKRLDITYREYEMINEPGIKRYGVVAQEVEKRYPELVRTNDEGYKSVAYSDLLIREIAFLKERIEYLERREYGRTS